MVIKTQNNKVRSAKVPALRFPEFSGEWEQKRLGSLCSIKTGKKDVNEGNPNGKYPFFTCARTNTYSNKYSFDGDAILIAGNGEVGNCQFYSGKFEAYQRTYVLQNFSVEVKYLFLYLGHSFQTLVSKQKQMGAMPYIKLGMLTDFHVCLPVAEEQQKIAEFFGAVDEKIEQLSKKKNSLERYKRGVMQKIFSQEIRFKPARNASRSDAGGDENGNSYPDWEEKRLGEIGEVIGGGTPDTADASLWNGEINWFTPTEIKQKYVSTSARNISAEGLRSSSAKLLPVGALLLTTRATIGDVAILKHEATTNQGFQSIVVNKKNSNDFIYYWILKNKKEFLRRANGSTFAEISGKEVKKIKGIFPSFLEQQKVADFLTSLDEKISAISSELDRAKDFKKGLLQQMFV